VIKPPPIRKIEQLISGGAGIMLDDILAAVYTNICLQLWRIILM
jgi:phosphatidylglycerophosphatase A